MSDRGFSDAAGEDAAGQFVTAPHAQAVGAVSAALDVLVGAGAWQVSDAEVAGLVVQLEVLARRVQAVQLGVVAEGISRGLPLASGAGTGASAPGRWLRSLVAITPGDAARRAGLAQALFSGPGHQELAPTRQALAAGAIGTAHAGHIVTALAQLEPPATPQGLIDEGTRAEAQSLLLGFAAGSDQHHALDPAQVAKAARTLCATVDPGADDRLARDEERQEQVRCLTLAALPSGMFHLSGLLTAVAGHKLFAALHAFAAPRPGVDGAPDPRSAGMRLHDGLDHLADLVLSRRDDVPSAHGSPTRLVVSVSAATLLAQMRERAQQSPAQPRGSSDGSPPSPRVPQLPGRWPLSSVSARVLACDADLVAILTGSDGSALDVSDTSYSFTAKQRTAIIERDQHCTFGTCTAPATWCHIHHVRAHSRGGPTSVDNGTLLCGTHHRHVHALQLVGIRSRDGTIEWQAPSGQCPAAPPPSVQRAIDNLAERFARRAAQRRRDSGQSAQDGVIGPTLDPP